MAASRSASGLSLLLWSLLVLIGMTSAKINLPCGEDWKNISRFEVLPGGGWDNLRNLEMPAVFQPAFNNCIESVDGRYVLPLHVRLLPNRESKMEIYSEIFEHYYNYRSLTATSINVDAHASFFGASIGGSFSKEHQHIKTTQLNTKSITARVQIRHNLYTALLDSGMPLSKDFQNRMLDIGYQLKLNNSRVADFMADMVISEYGTHYITRIDAGAVIWRLDFSKNYGRTMTDEEITKMRASASVGFGSMFGVSGSWSSTVDVKTVDQYKHNITDSQVASVGGAPIRPNITITQWSDSVPQNLVPVDRAGVPLYYAITAQRLGEMPYQMVGKIRKRVKQAVERYYKANIIKGCMEQTAANFNPLANLPSEECKARRFKFAFGGVYQTCSGPYCSGNVINNIITGGLSCPPEEYRPILLHSRTYRCDSFCHGWWLWKHCNTRCSTYSIYWCSAKYTYSDPRTGFLFGGLFSARAVNPMTQQKNCPSSFLTFVLGAGDMSICLSRDFELGEDHAYNFGGFYSCVSGNPYTVIHNKTSGVTAPGQPDLRFLLSSKAPEVWPKACPRGFAQHLATVDGNCEVMFCTKAMQLKTVLAAVVQSPPFVKLPDDSVPPPRPDATMKLDTKTGSWIYDNKDSTWKHGEDVGQLKTAVAFLGSLLGTVCLAILIAGVIFMRRRQRQRDRSNPEMQPLLSGPVNSNNSDSPAEA